MTGTRALFLVSLLLLLGACSDSGRQPAFPRPTAYPRPNLPDTMLIFPENLPLRFAVNAEAVISEPRPGWLDVAYPTLGATAHITFSEVGGDRMEDAKANRMQRLLLNAGDSPTDFSEFSNRAGFDIVMARTPGSSTPVQFIATDNSAWLVSGAVYIPASGSQSATDSIKPVVKAVQSDIQRALNSLDYR